MNATFEQKSRKKGVHKVNEDHFYARESKKKNLLLRNQSERMSYFILP